MEVRYQPTEQDILAVAFQEAMLSPPLRRTVRLLQILLPVAIAAIGAIALLTLAPVTAVSLLFGMVVLSGGLVVIWYFLKVRRIARKRTELILKEANNNPLAERHLFFDPVSIKSRTESGEHTIRWPAIQRLQETPEHVFLYLESCIAIPRRAFASEREYKEFVTFLHDQHASNHP